jgi:protein Mpv17
LLQDLSNIDVTSFVQFILYTISISPPNYLWQKLLEDSFPSKIPAKTKATDIKKSGSTTAHRENDEQFSLTNTAFKFILDQTVGAIVNTVLFICLLDTFRGTTYSQMKSHVMEVRETHSFIHFLYSVEIFFHALSASPFASGTRIFRSVTC